MSCFTYITKLIRVFFLFFFKKTKKGYELSHGITPANYDMRGEAGGLARIDAIFNSQGYTTTFQHSPIVFGAFPSLHAGFATLEALFLSHYFPRWRVFYWTYAFMLYWSTMYLTYVFPQNWDVLTVLGREVEY